MHTYTFMHTYTDTHTHRARVRRREKDTRRSVSARARVSKCEKTRWKKEPHSQQGMRRRRKTRKKDTCMERETERKHTRKKAEMEEKERETKSERVVRERRRKYRGSETAHRYNVCVCDAADAGKQAVPDWRMKWSISANTPTHTYIGSKRITKCGDTMKWL